MAIYLPTRSTSIHLSNLTWSNAIESNRIESTVISSNLMQYLHNLNPRKSEDLSTMAAPRGWSCDAWASRCTRHWSILPSGGSSKAKKKKTWPRGHRTFAAEVVWDQLMDSVWTRGSGGSFIFRFSSFNPPLHLQKSCKITNAGGKLQKRQTHGIYVHKLDPKVKTSRLATSNATNSSCHFGESMVLI